MKDGDMCAADEGEWVGDNNPDHYDRAEYEEVLNELPVYNIVVNRRGEVLICKYNVWVSQVKVTRGMMVCDEAHNLRDPRGTIARMCLALPCRNKIRVTATPSLNKVEDIFGPALQIWRSSHLRPCGHTETWSVQFHP